MEGAISSFLEVEAATKGDEEAVLAVVPVVGGDAEGALAETFATEGFFEGDGLFGGATIGRGDEELTVAGIEVVEVELLAEVVGGVVEVGDGSAVGAEGEVAGDGGAGEGVGGDIFKG